MRIFVPVLAFFTILVSVAPAFGDAPSQVETPQGSVELLSEFEAAAPGATQWIGIHFKPKEGWHVYWKNPGDSGLPPKGEFESSPGGSRFGPLEFPTPDRIPYGPLVNYGYEGEVLYPAKWSAPTDLSLGGNITVTAKLKWLICKSECVPGRATLSLTLPVKDAREMTGVSGTHSKLFKSTLRAFPSESRGKIRLVLSPDGERVELAFSSSEAKALSPAALKRVFFFPEGEYGIASDAKQVVKKTSDGFQLTIPRKVKKPVGEIRGVLKIGDEKGFIVSEVIDPKLLAASRASVSTVASNTASSAQSTDTPSLLLMLLFALIGGIILNLMPCILPILSIKVLALASQSGLNRSEIRKHGLVFTLGILVSFWCLAGVLLAVRSSGQILGWGFQLQNPIFVGVLALLFFIMALNLFGVFEIGSRLMGTGGKFAAKDGYTGSFFTGVLTTIAATPCSAPFMGSALGFALTQPASIAFLVLTVLALGLALPYLLFSFLPAAAKILPRPGVWMKTLKELLAFPLLGTVVWLVWVLGNQTGNDGILLILTALVTTTAVIWLLGMPAIRFVPKMSRAILILLLSLLTFGVIASLKIKPRVATLPGGQSGSSLVHAPWKNWSPEAQAAALAAGKTVLIDFTADWCVTCKVNEALVFERTSVKEALSKDSVVALLADWTNGDPAVTEALTKVGRNSVPVYLLYKNGSATPKILPQILTVDGLLKELE